jgi:hypothetical protein
LGYADGANDCMFLRRFIYDFERCAQHFAAWLVLHRALENFEKWGDQVFGEGYLAAL